MRLAIVCLLVLFAAPATAGDWQYEHRDGYVIAWKVLPYGVPVQPLPYARPWQEFWDWLRTQEKRDGYVIAWKAYPYYGAPVQPLPRAIPADTWQRFLDWLRTQENSCADNLPAPYFNPNNACFELNNRR